MNFNQFISQNSPKAPDFKEDDVNLKLQACKHARVCVCVCVCVCVEQEEHIALEVMVQ